MSEHFVACAGHDSSRVQPIGVGHSYDEAVDLVHNFFIGRGFELRNGRPYDDGNANYEDDEDGFDCFDEVELHNGQVAGFTHYGGSGPAATIVEC